MSAENELLLPEELALKIGFRQGSGNTIYRNGSSRSVYKDKNGRFYFTFRLMTILYKVYYHRFIWTCHYGGTYKNLIHIDGDKSNNLITNIYYRAIGVGGMHEEDLKTD